MEIEEITLDGWELFSDRRNSRNYFNKDKTKILKLFSAKYNISEEKLFKEKKVCDEVYNLGLPTPKCYRIVKVGEEFGIESEYIDDKISFSRAISQDFETRFFYIDKFCEVSKKLHSTEYDGTTFPSMKDMIWRGMKKAYFFNEEERENIKKFLDTIPDRKICLMRDFQLSNMIYSKKRDKSYLIDLGTFCYGDPLFDLANFYYFTNYVKEYGMLKIMHLNAVQCKECWNIFIRKYFDTYNEEQIKEVENTLFKLAILVIVANLNDYDYVEEFARDKRDSFDDVFKNKN